MSEVYEARDFAIKAHGNQLYGGEPYGVHLFDVVAVAREFGCSDAQWKASFLHDVLEDTPVTSDQILDLFGEDVLRIVYACTGEGEERHERARTITICCRRNASGYHVGVVRNHGSYQSPDDDPHWRTLGFGRLFYGRICAPDMPWRDRQKVMREGAWQFHGGTSWGKRVWAKHCRAYLEMHGKPKRAVDAPRTSSFRSVSPPPRRLTFEERIGE